MKRRNFLQLGTAAVAANVVAGQGGCRAGAQADDAAHAPSHPPPGIPRWRGFNLQEKISHTPEEWQKTGPEWGHDNEPFRRLDFEMIAELGFDFARLAMSYKCWTDPRNPDRLIESTMKDIDQAVEYGRRCGVHVSLNFIRAPGYYICDFGETRDKLWLDPGCQELFIGQWRQFARRYKGVASARLSFDLVNEPMNVSGEDYARLMRRVVAAIRAEDPQRLIIVEGLDVAVQPVSLLADLGVVQSYHCYAPKEVTHYKAPWAGDYPHLPAWPLKKNGKITFAQGDLDKKFKAWRDLAAKGVPVHIGEFGCYKHTPHDVALAWMRDVLALAKDAQWGWALWCLRGSFGILDSGRDDVHYEDFHGHKLDRKMLALLQAS